MKKFLLLGFMLTMISFSTSAQTNATEQVKKQRVIKNVKNGNLTKAELTIIKKDDRRQKLDKRRALSDGKITAMEKRRLAKTRRHERRKFVALKNNQHKRPL